MKLLILAFATVFSSVAMADFSGSWQGTGMEKNADGSQAACPKMTLSLTHSAAKLDINSGHFDCGDFSMDFSPYSIAIQGNQLVDNNGVVIGTIDQSKAHMELVDATYNTKVIYDGEIVSGLLYFKQVYLDPAGKLYFSVEGKFAR
jgi:hypothetical protein